MSDQKKKQALDYHSEHPPGKIEVHPTKSVLTQLDLSLAYSPGVAEPCREISSYPINVYKYTSKGNLVGVISNGTAVLGLGNIGPEASKPVMEGKGVLFKKFAGIDVFDIEVNATDPQEFIRIVKALEPTFGGINLEDIKAPESFLIEETLRKELKVPIMHDDQHGTAIISAAALLNALELVNKSIEEVEIVVNGAGAAAMACVNLYLKLGAQKDRIVMVDSKGVIRSDRVECSALKQRYATSKDLHTLEDAIVGADMFLGLSKGDVLSADMLLKMSSDPIVFALANPDPEISYETAVTTRSDLIMATGRSDHPNQVNNVLGFPYIFRGALDVRATCINEEMKLAAVYALADLAKKPVPESVAKAYGADKIVFGRSYLIPKPLDPRLITVVSTAVARAAMESKVSQLDIYDWKSYEQQLQARVGIDTGLITQIISRASQGKPQRIAFADADNRSVFKAACMLAQEGIGVPILIGHRLKIEGLIKEYEAEGYDLCVLDPMHEEALCREMAQLLCEKRQRRGVHANRAEYMVRDTDYFGALLLEMGKTDVFISGSVDNYNHVLKIALEVIGLEENIRRPAGMYILNNAQWTFFLSDVSVNIDPDAALLSDIVTLSVQLIRSFNWEPRVALLSYSNFGSNRGDIPEKMQETLRIVQKRDAKLIIDGDIQANVALSREILEEMYAFSRLKDSPANTLIFPNLASGNIAYKLLMEVGGFQAIGPILMGMRRPMHILQQGASEREIYNLSALAIGAAQGHIQLT